MKLTDQTAVITGAASGIGLATAEAFAAAGATVILGDLNAEAGRAAAERLRAGGARAEFISLDVTSPAAVDAFARDALAVTGAVHVVANVAGWSKVQPFMDTDPDLWDRLIDINYTGVLRVTRAFLPGMIERKSGKIVNVASDAGRVGSGGESIYSGAKGAVVAFSKALAREMARHLIHVNCVCPGPTDTPLLASIPDKQREALSKIVPFRRFAKPSEVADTVLFFASPRSDYITGQVISVSGGLTMHG